VTQSKRVPRAAALGGIVVGSPATPHARATQARRVLAAEAERYRQIFNHIRPHETLNGHRPIEVYRDPTLHPQLSNPDS